MQASYISGYQKLLLVPAQISEKYWLLRDSFLIKSGEMFLPAFGFVYRNSLKSLPGSSWYLLVKMDGILCY